MNTQKSSTELSDAKRAELRKAAYALKPTVQVGKSGFTLHVIGEIKRQLAQKKLVKVKLLKGLFDTMQKKDAADLLVQLTGAKLVHKVGFVVVLYRH